MNIWRKWADLRRKKFNVVKNVEEIKVEEIKVEKIFDEIVFGDEKEEVGFINI